MTRRTPGRAAAALALALLAAGGCGKSVLLGPPPTGTLRILSEPEGAVIIFDGAGRGTTFNAKPIVLKGVTYGRHTVRAEFPGRVPRVEEVDFARPEAEIRIPLSRSRFGGFAVYVDPPGAEVFIDSRYYGKAAPKIEVNDLPFGEHSLWVRLEGYEVERQVIVVERQTDRAFRLFLRKQE